MGWRRTALILGVALGVACSGTDGPGPERDAGVDASSGGATIGGAGGTLSGGAGGVGGTSMGGSAGDDGCLPECFAPTQCVKQCGDVPEDYGCCPCPEGYVDVLTCPDAG
ncbi:MAG: hypothetical protein KC766_26065 [Myxococcales bacterium]|nr:hypothetical protein [Myxococcales bacterium]